MGADGKRSSTPSSLKDEFTPSLDVWYTDGSIVLVAEKTAFRVHGTILAANSEIFKDMFAIPQSATPDPDAETYEGCPVLRLQDSPADLKHFLKAIYDFSYFPPRARTKFPVVAAVLRLSTKYHAPALRQRAIDLMTTVYPSSTADWTKRSHQRLIPPFEDEHVAYIALAIETDIRVILPAVYFAATRAPLAGVLTQMRKLAVAHSVQWDVCTDFLVGRERLQQAEITHILGFLANTFARPGCRDSNDNNLLLTAARNAVRRVVDQEPYHQWCSAKPAEVGPALGLCAVCCDTVTESIEQARRKVWEQLPGYFNLADWETLLARDGVWETLLARDGVDSAFSESV